MSEINKILKEKLLNYKETPPSELFDNIKKHYPKKTFAEFINYNKYSFVALISAVVLISSILYFAINNKENNIVELSEIVEDRLVGDRDLQKEEYLIIAKQEQNLSDKETKNKDSKIINSKTPEIKELCINVFDIKDTVICGNSFVVNKRLNKEKLLVPENMKLIIKDGKTIFQTEKNGKFTIYYVDNELKDSVNVEYLNTPLNKMSYSKDYLCFNESLEVFIENNNSEIKWANKDFVINEIAKDRYIISNIRPGVNNLKFSIIQSNCEIECNKKITVEEDLKYQYYATTNYCSKSNASLIVELNNSTPNMISLNNSIYSNDGRFDSLNSGIYYLDINYAEGCIKQDTLVILDSLSLFPFFEIIKDESTPNKYFFKNRSLIDGEETPERNISYLWSVNDIIVSSSKDFEAELGDRYRNNINLQVIVDDNCFSSYSNTLLLSENKLKIPNIFTPNGDGVGDQFTISCEDEIHAFNIKIFNNRGEKIFESDNIDNSWDGRINGGNSHTGEGVYYYTINWRSKYDNKYSEKGFVKLIR